ncbi:hypothetical protein CAOG_03300 [Capsaspora owczarzaki ATCC 30864]|uniref:S5 DRBM domain-containing protein n=1 Tax=Capsaspora owczarzaki (strain ATCC 30864) TaxID=595528 RepID=A0A0D2X2C1_CAPO3|nr:hypothetical protein CAOG_03300 [Capsaspora owczarzaki ATCC 30864]KJE92299.1 hypothetical protein CAOG_003300 [Capsaspora owczarzaki ATCC 30864]|eukprot:XP_004364139.1 hypothetical protein CAOG_03300 [Capsaspora owczarzaki ATCC 30864]
MLVGLPPRLVLLSSGRSLWTCAAGSVAHAGSTTGPSAAAAAAAAATTSAAGAQQSSQVRDTLPGPRRSYRPVVRAAYKGGLQAPGLEGQTARRPTKREWGQAASTLSRKQQIALWNKQDAATPLEQRNRRLTDRIERNVVFRPSQQVVEEIVRDHLEEQSQAREPDDEPKSRSELLPNLKFLRQLRNLPDSARGTSSLAGSGLEDLQIDLKALEDKAMPTDEEAHARRIEAAADIYHPTNPLSIRTKAMVHVISRGFQVRLVEVKRVSTMLRTGRRHMMQALALVGNGRGVIGFGMSKDAVAQQAVHKAIIQACHNLYPIPRFNMHTIYHPMENKEGRSLVKMWPAPQGHGLVCHGVIRMIAELAGISDLTATVINSKRNYHNIVRATVFSLYSQQTARDVALKHGKNLLEMKRIPALTRPDFL